MLPMVEHHRAMGEWRPRADKVGPRRNMAEKKDEKPRTASRRIDPTSLPSSVNDVQAKPIGLLARHRTQSP